MTIVKHSSSLERYTNAGPNECYIACNTLNLTFDNTPLGNIYLQRKWEARGSFSIAEDIKAHQPPSTPPFPDMNGSQILKIDYNDWKSCVCVQTDQGDTLFTARREPTSPRLEILDKDGNIIGKTKTSSVTTRLDVEILNTSAPTQAFEIHNHAVFGSPRYSSPAFGEQTIEWKGKAMTKRIIYDVTDEAGKVYAKFESDPKSKVGNFEILEESLNQDQLRELAVVLLSLLVRKLRNINDVPQYGIVN